jgi:hypothetical protein
VAILYLHRISDNRLASASLKNIQMFSKLCGSNVMPNVIITTTMWGEIDTKTGVCRERELREICKDALGDGCSVLRFENTFDSAWGLIDHFSSKSGMQVQLPQKVNQFRQGSKERYVL